jgi:allophanate hydrolase
VYQDLNKLKEKRAAAFAAIATSSADFLVVPTVMHHYLVSEVVQQETETPSKTEYNSYLGTFTNFVNLLGMCAVSVPAGRLPDVHLQVCTLQLDSCATSRLLEVVSAALQLQSCGQS